MNVLLCGCLPDHVNFHMSRFLSRQMSVRFCCCVIIYKIFVAVCHVDEFPSDLSNFSSKIQLKSPPKIFSSVEDKKAEML